MLINKSISLKKLILLLAVCFSSAKTNFDARRRSSEYVISYFYVNTIAGIYSGFQLIEELGWGAQEPHYQPLRGKLRGQLHSSWKIEKLMYLALMTGLGNDDTVFDMASAINLTVHQEILVYHSKMGIYH